MRSFRVSSVVRAGPEAVCARASTLAIDDDDIHLEAVDPGRAFRERSQLGSRRAWHHDRTLIALPDGTRIVDEVAFTSRLPAAGGLLAFVLEATFRRRHRRLRRMWR